MELRYNMVILVILSAVYFCGFTIIKRSVFILIL
jgi:hypothetical protein